MLVLIILKSWEASEAAYVQGPEFCATPLPPSYNDIVKKKKKFSVKLAYVSLA